MKLEYFNAQEQQKMVWPASFALVRAYLDQAERARALDGARITAVRAELSRVERLSGAARTAALHQLGGQLDADAQRSSDAVKARRLSAAVHQLAGS